MTPDIKTKDFYLQFKREALLAYNDIYRRIVELNKIYEEAKTYISDNKDDIKKIFCIDLNSYDEFVKEEYNNSETLYNKALQIYHKNINHPSIKHIINVIKYCNAMRSKSENETKLAIRKYEMNIPFRAFVNYLAKFYNMVHKVVLDGGGYKFGYNLGMLIINSVDFSYSKPRVDYNETRKRKEELIKDGKKIYNKNEDAWYKYRNIPYDGVKYSVIKKKGITPIIALINYDKVRQRKVNFKHTQYINKKYRNLTQHSVADQYCKTKEDVYNLQVDLKFKLNVLLYKGYVTHLTYVRNTKKYKYNSRKNYS